MWIKLTDNRLINLSQAYDIEFKLPGTLFVWWTGAFPATPDRTEMATIYDTARLCQYDVSTNEWQAFLSRAVPPMGQR